MNFLNAYLEKPYEKPPKNEKFEYMKYHIQICKGLAMWPMEKTDDTTKKFYHNASVFLVLMLCLALFLPLVLKMIWDFQNWDGIATVIDFATVVASGIFRYTYIYVRSEKYSQLIDSMYKKFIFESFYPAENPLTMTKFIKIGAIVGILYAGSAFVWIFQMCFGPLVAYYLFEDYDELNSNATVKLPLVFEAAYPFDITKQPNHGLVYVFQAVGFITIGYIYLVIDALWYMIITLTIGQFVLIKHSLKNVKSILDEERIRNDPSGKERRKAIDGIEEALSKCANQHKLTRQFVHEIENVLCPNVIVDFLHAIISISFILLDTTIAINNHQWMKAFHLFEYFTVSIVHMFLFDYLGNELFVQEQELSFAVYDTPWLLCSKKVKNHVMLTTMQARQPLWLTGGKMYNMNLEFFAWTQKLIFSYFMVLLQLRNERKN